MMWSCFIERNKGSKSPGTSCIRKMIKLKENPGLQIQFTSFFPSSGPTKKRYITMEIP